MGWGKVDLDWNLEAKGVRFTYAHALQNRDAIRGTRASNSRAAECSVGPIGEFQMKDAMKFLFLAAGLCAARSAEAAGG